MADEAVVIPEKIYFKIGEVCELVGVQAHVLRYWETEFPMLSPQKNKSGQRSYRRRDVKMALRIKQLLYNEMFTIAGAKKKLIAESRSGSKAKEGEARAPSEKPAPNPDAPTLFDNVYEKERTVDSGRPAQSFSAAPARATDNSERELLKTVAAHLLELREMLRVQH